MVSKLDQEVDCPISVYTEAIQSNPNDVAAYLARGTLHLETTDFNSAIKDLTKAIELKPDSCILQSWLDLRGDRRRATSHSPLSEGTSARPVAGGCERQSQAVGGNTLAAASIANEVFILRAP